MKNELYEQSYKNLRHFSFGKNWQNFLKNLSDKKIEEAEKSLTDFLDGKNNIFGKTFVDIGCGSGLFSLAAYRLGVKKIISVDIDEFSISCTKYLRSKVGNPKNWEIREGSALDEKFLDSLGIFDIVYSWGVLHHTGDMYKALENITQLVNPIGKLYIALYNDNQRFLEGKSSLWFKIKKEYNKSNAIAKKMVEIIYTIYYIIGLIVNRKNPFTYIKNYESLRGMDFMTDIRDWLGGYPYEYATTEETIEFFAKKGFGCEKTVPARSVGCNEFLLAKRTP